MEMLRQLSIKRYLGLSALLLLVVIPIAYSIEIPNVEHVLTASLIETLPKKPAVMPAPSEMRAIYATAMTVARPKRVDELIAFAHATGVNAIVVNVKDGDGVYLNDEMSQLAHRLRAEGIYPIARVVVFQDNYLARMWPEEALQTKTGETWKGRGYMWMDPASKNVWDYTTEVAIEALNEGFAEINFDYVRFPADGDIESIMYPVYDKKSTRSEVITAYITSAVKKEYPDAVLSVDIFAHSLIDSGDVGIGQHFVDFLGVYDVVAPMIYPSHYATGNFGFTNPAEAPYEVVLGTLNAGKLKAEKAGKPFTVRPWLQDFNMGAVYDRTRIEAQIKAVKDVGLSSGWMMWNPSNRYSLVKYAGVASSTSSQ
jgi:hypothetical protein